MTDIVTYCDVNTCEDCPRYGDDCDGDKRVEHTDLISRADAVKTVIRKCSPICAWQVGTQQYPDSVVAEINALPSADAVDCTDFIEWLVDRVLDETIWEYNSVAYGEIICRKLEKLGVLETTEEPSYYIRPSAEAVEVVRCKDCKHHEKFCFDDSKLLCWVHDIDIVVSPTDYCSYAERREDGEV